MWIYVHIFVLFAADYTSSCQLPVYMDGSWSDNRFLDVQFSGGTTMYLPSYSISRKGSTTNLTCYINDGNIYVLRTTESIENTISGINDFYYYYLCMDITQITDYSFYYYLQTGEDTNTERITAHNSSLTFDSTTPFCTITLDLKLFNIMVKNGYESAALQTCSTPLLGAFTFQLENSAGTTCISTGLWSYTDETYSTLNISYTTGVSCQTKIGLSVNSNVGCLMCIQSGTTYYTALVNLDTSDSNTFSSKFTCMVSTADGNNITFTQRARLCDEQQTSSDLPSTVGIYPDSNSLTVGALVYLVSTGGTATKVSDCFPRITTTTTTNDDSSNNIIVIVVVIVCIIIVLVLVMLIAAIIYRGKRKMKRQNNNEVPTQGGNFLVTLRSALLAGVGISNKREKQLTERNGETIRVDDAKDKRPIPAENESNLQDVRIDTIPVTDKQPMRGDNESGMKDVSIDTQTSGNKQPNSEQNERIETPNFKTQKVFENIPSQSNACLPVPQNATDQEKDKNESAITENKVSDFSTVQKKNDEIPPKSKEIQLLSHKEQTRGTGNKISVDEQLSPTAHDNAKIININNSESKVPTNDNIQKQTPTVVTKSNGNKTCSKPGNASTKQDINENQSLQHPEYNNKSVETTKPNNPLKESVDKTSGLSIQTASTSMDSFRNDDKERMSSLEFQKTDERFSNKDSLKESDVVAGYAELMNDEKRNNFITSSTGTKSPRDVLNDTGNSASRPQSCTQSYHSDGTAMEITMPNEVQKPEAKEKCESRESFHETVKNIHTELDNFPGHTLEQHNKSSNHAEALESGHDNDQQPFIPTTLDHGSDQQPFVPKNISHNNDQQAFIARNAQHENSHSFNDGNDLHIDSVTPGQTFTDEELLPGQIVSPSETRLEVPSQSKSDSKNSETSLTTPQSEYSPLLKQGTFDKESGINNEKNKIGSSSSNTFNELVSPNIEVKSMTGNSGTGKTQGFRQSNDDNQKPSRHDYFTRRNQLFREPTRLKLYHAPENVMKIQYERRYKKTVSLKKFIDQKKEKIRKQVKNTKSPYHSKITITGS